MKYWAGREHNQNGRYELFLGDMVRSSAVLYFEKAYGESIYTFSVCDNGTAFDRVLLKAQALDEAKIEVEKWLKELYLKRISGMEDAIILYKQWIEMLSSGEEEGKQS